MRSGNTLSKDERLSSKVGLTTLVNTGRYGTEQFLKYCFSKCNSLPYNRIVVSVPKRLFRRAVKRNLLKRRLREAYRLNKSLLPATESSGEGMRYGGTDILFIYNSKEVYSQERITSAMIQILKFVASYE